MLSEQAREKFILRHREHYGSMVIDEVDVDVNGLLEAQHKADLEEWKREKQEIISTLNDLDNWIEYIHGKFQETGTGNAYRVRIDNMIKILSTNGG